MKKLLLLTVALTAQAQNWSLGASATWTSWTTSLTRPLQTPGWTLPGHPGGCLDVQWRSVYGEACGDPHRPQEATTLGFGLRKDFVHKGPVELFGQVSAGVLEAPSFNEYCWSYEYQYGDCHAGAKPPEECLWANVNVGPGVRVWLGNRFALEAKVEYENPYGIGPRWRFTYGFRVKRRKR